MKRAAFVVGVSLALGPQAVALNLMDWLLSLGAPQGESRAPRLLAPVPPHEPALVHQLERPQRLEVPAAGEFVYSFGELSEALSVEAFDGSTGLPYLLLVSTSLPRKVLATQALTRGVDGDLLVVNENLVVSPDARVVRVRDLDPGSLSNRSFKIYDGQGVRTTRDLPSVDLFAAPGNEAGEYLAAPGSQGFPAQMAYYHLSLARRRLLEAGIPVPSGPAPIFVNIAGISHGIYQRRRPYLLAFGERQAADSDILYHEYGHAVVDRLNASLMLEGESQFASAIHEAFGDVLAFALNGNPRIGEWGGQPMRNIRNDARYPGGCLDPKLGRFEPHFASRVVSGVLFEFSRLVGRMEAVSLFTQAIADLPASPSFYDFRQAAVGVARSKYGDPTAEALAAFFETRGVTLETAGNDAAYLASERLVLRDGRGRALDQLGTRGRIEVVVEGEVHSARPGYNLLSDLELSGPPGFEKTAVLFNGRWPAGNGQVVAPLGSVVIQDAPVGTYQVRARVKIGGNQRTYFLYKSFSVK